jgi:hypothetical protein
LATTSWLLNNILWQQTPDCWTTYFDNNLLAAEHRGIITALVCRFILSMMHINQIVTHDSQNRIVLEQESLDCLTLTFKALRFWKESLGLINPWDLLIRNIRKLFFFSTQTWRWKKVRFFETTAHLSQSTRIHIPDDVTLQQPQISYHLFSLQERIFLSQRLK